MYKIKFILLTLTLLGSLVFAQEKTQKDSTQQRPLTNEEAQDIRNSVKALGTLFGVNQQQTNSQQNNNQGNGNEQNSGKTMADVADKALDYVTKAVTTIAANLEKAAPWVWKVMIRQQYANALSKLIVPWSLFFAVMISGTIIRKKWKTGIDESINDESDAKTVNLLVGRVIPWVLMAIFAIWGFNRLSDSIQLLINPEYYAIRDLINTIINPGGTLQ